MDVAVSALEELRSATRGEVVLGEERLIELYQLLTDLEYEHPDDTPGGVPWSEPLGLLAAELTERTESAASRRLSDYAIVATQAYGARLDREGRRPEALGVFTDAVQRYPEQPYSVSLLLELGALLRDEHEFGRALVELHAARALLERLRADDHGPEFASYVPVFDALIASELGAATEALGMKDAADGFFEKAEALALALDDAAGPPVWGGNLVYRLNQALHRERPHEVRAPAERFRAHRWRELLPEETALQIRARLGIAEVMAAFRGDATHGAGEDELRALLAADLMPDEELLVTVFLAQSLLDRGATAEADTVLASALALLQGTPAQEPRRLHALGLRARLLRETGAAPEALRSLLVDELRPAFEDFLARAQRGPLEEAGISLLLLDWVRATLSQLFELEVAVDEGGAGVERAFAWLGRLHAAGTFAREQGLAAPALDEVRATLLAPGRCVLAYVPGRVESHLFALDERGLSMIRLGPAWTLDAAARALEEALLSAIGAPAPGAEARLSTALAAASRAFVPAEAEALLARSRSVVVLGLEGFGYVPLEALSGPAGEPLGRTHEVTYEPSLPVGVWLARRAAALAPAEGPAILYVGQGDPARGGRPELAPLSLEPARLDGEAFTRAGVPWRLLGPEEVDELPAALRGARLVSFLAHGIYDGARVRPAGLLIAPEERDGAWFAEALEGLSALPLAIVAACGTDRAPLRRGDDGRGHLRASFFRRGSACVVTATLALELEATVDFCAALNGRLAAGDSIAAAFHAARRGARPEEHGVHPVHAYLLHVWGAGDLRPVATATPGAGPAPLRAEVPGRRRLPVVLAGGAALLAVAALVLRRVSVRRSPSQG